MVTKQSYRRGPRFVATVAKARAVTEDGDELCRSAVGIVIAHALSLKIGDTQFRIRILPGALKLSLGDRGLLSFLLRLQTLHQSKQRTAAMFVSLQIGPKQSCRINVVSAAQ